MKNKGTDSTVAQSFGTSPARIRCITAFAIGVVTIDFILILCTVQNMYTWRMVLAISAVAALYLLAGRDQAAIGLMLRPRQGFRYWTKVTMVLGAILVLLLFLGLVGCWAADVSVPYKHAPRFHPMAMFGLLVHAPVFEELVYRLVLLTPLLALIGSRWTIIVGGAVFAALHFAYGTPGPDNFVAGYLLAWAYTKSGSILIPVVLHSLGNACSFAFYMSYWYLIK